MRKWLGLKFLYVGKLVMGEDLFEEWLFLLHNVWVRRARNGGYEMRWEDALPSDYWVNSTKTGATENIKRFL